MKNLQIYDFSVMKHIFFTGIYVGNCSSVQCSHRLRWTQILWPIITFWKFIFYCKFKFHFHISLRCIIRQCVKIVNTLRISGPQILRLSVIPTSSCRFRLSHQVPQRHLPSPTLSQSSDCIRRIIRRDACGLDADEVPIHNTRVDATLFIKYILFIAYYKKLKLFLLRSLASSAPIWQFTGMTPCDAFYRVTSSAYSTVSEQCALSVKKSWDYINQLGSSGKYDFWAKYNLFNTITFEFKEHS